MCCGWQCLGERGEQSAITWIERAGTPGVRARCGDRRIQPAPGDQPKTRLAHARPGRRALDVAVEVCEREERVGEVEAPRGDDPAARHGARRRRQDNLQLECLAELVITSARRTAALIGDERATARRIAGEKGQRARGSRPVAAIASRHFTHPCPGSRTASP